MFLLRLRSSDSLGFRFIFKKVRARILNQPPYSVLFCIFTRSLSWLVITPIAQMTTQLRNYFTNSWTIPVCTMQKVMRSLKMSPTPLHLPLVMTWKKQRKTVLFAGQLWRRCLRMWIRCVESHLLAGTPFYHYLIDFCLFVYLIFLSCLCFCVLY